MPGKAGGGEGQAGLGREQGFSGQSPRPMWKQLALPRGLSTPSPLLRGWGVSRVFIGVSERSPGALWSSHSAPEALSPRAWLWWPCSMGIGCPCHGPPPAQGRGGSAPRHVRSGCHRHGGGPRRWLSLPRPARLLWLVLPLSGREAESRVPNEHFCHTHLACKSWPRTEEGAARAAPSRERHRK